MSKSEKAPGGVTPEQSGKKLPGFVKKVGALAFALLAVGGIWHKAHEPAMSDEQMDKATDVVREAVLDRAEYIVDNASHQEDDSRKGDFIMANDGNSLSSLHISVNRGIPVGEETIPGVGEVTDYSDEGTSVRLCILEDKKSEGYPTDSYVCATFSSESSLASDGVKGDNGEVDYRKAIEFVKSPEVWASEMYYTDDYDKNGRIEEFKCDPGKECSGDPSSTIYISRNNGVGKGLDVFYSGEEAVNQVQEAIDTVKSNWGDDESKK